MVVVDTQQIRRIILPNPIRLLTVDFVQAMYPNCQVLGNTLSNGQGEIVIHKPVITQPVIR